MYRRHQSSKPNKRFDGEATPEQLAYWRRTVTYGGNAEHKINPGDFGLIPPFGPRRGKTLCDGVSIFERAVALRLLREGIRRGLVSAQKRNGFPQNIWAVADDGTPLEAALDNRETGSYHGYPIWTDDQFGRKVLEKWNAFHE
jgi:hypothetical protein